MTSAAPILLLLVPLAVRLSAPTCSSRKQGAACRSSIGVPGTVSPALIDLSSAAATNQMLALPSKQPPTHPSTHLRAIHKESIAAGAIGEGGHSQHMPLAVVHICRLSSRGGHACSPTGGSAEQIVARPACSLLAPPPLPSLPARPLARLPTHRRGWGAGAPCCWPPGRRCPGK